MEDYSYLDKQYFIDSTVYNCPFCNRKNVVYKVNYTFDFNCVFRGIPDTHSGANRTVILAKHACFQLVIIDGIFDLDIQLPF
jgi:hypothetical protein